MTQPCQNTHTHTQRKKKDWLSHRRSCKTEMNGWVYRRSGRKTAVWTSAAGWATHTHKHTQFITSGWAALFTSSVITSASSHCLLRSHWKLSNIFLLQYTLFFCLWAFIKYLYLLWLQTKRCGVYCNSIRWDSRRLLYVLEVLEGNFLPPNSLVSFFLSPTPLRWNLCLGCQQSRGTPFFPFHHKSGFGKKKKRQTKQAHLEVI